jgi:CheY-like chemotaxis protein
MRVLIVDDQDEVATSLADGLGMRGYETVVAHDAPTALLACTSFKPDVALLDIALPVIDGYELGNRLRRCGVSRLVAVTGTAHAERSREAGFQAHLDKPVTIDGLDRVLRTLGESQDA